MQPTWSKLAQARPELITTLQSKVVSFNCTLYNVVSVREFPTSPHFRSARSRGDLLALLATPSSPPRALMKDPIATAGVPDDFASQEDEGLLAYVNTLRLSIKEKVAAEQQRGLSLSEIVVQVREMVRVAEEDARYSKRFPPRAFRAISRQALAWCVEAYRPLAFTAGDELSPQPDPLAQSDALDRAGTPANRFPDRSTS